MKLPKYQITIDDQYAEGGKSLGIERTALTKNPAIKVKGIAFSTDEPSAKLSFKDNLKYRIAAPAIIPSVIYRNQDDSEFYVEFTEKEIEKIHSKFMKNLDKNKGLFNLEHNDGEIVPAYLLECWIVDNPREDKAFSSFGLSVPKGTLMYVAQITDKDYYNKLVADDAIGFSVQGYWGLQVEEKIEDNNKEIKLNEMKLPDGEHLIGEKIYIVKDGEVIEIKDVVKEAEMAEVAIEEDTKKVEEVEMAEAVVAEEVAVEAPVEEVEVSETYSKEEIDAKFDELYQLVAKLSKPEEVAVEEVKLSAVEKKEEKSIISGFSALRSLIRG